ncbi:4971_t:CDS:2, partial [Acaulospora colombiana]
MVETRLNLRLRTFVKMVEEVGLILNGTHPNMGLLAGNVPGGVLKTIIQEHAHFEQFVDLLKRRGHKAVSGHLWGLLLTSFLKVSSFHNVVPVLIALVEVIQRREVCESVTTWISNLDIAKSPNFPDESGVPISAQYTDLGELFREYENCRLEASSPASIAELKAWHEHNFTSWTCDLRPGDIPLFNLPPSGELALEREDNYQPDLEKAFRRSITRLQDRATSISTWHKEKFPVRNRAWEIANERLTFLGLYVELVTHLDYTKDQTQAFSSSAFISKAHDGQQLEAEHASMQPVNHVDFVTGETKDAVIF